MNSIWLGFIFSMMSMCTYASTIPITMDYCTTDYSGIASNGTTVLCYGTHGVIASSTDKGGSWTRKKFPLQSSISKIDTIASTFVALSGGSLLVSSDDADTWRIVCRDSIVEYCHNSDTLYVFTRNTLLRVQLSSPNILVPIISFERQAVRSGAVLSSCGTMHWTENYRSVVSLNLTTFELEKSDILELSSCQSCVKISALQCYSTTLYVAVVDSTSSNSVNNVTYDDYYEFYESKDCGRNWKRWARSNNILDQTLGFVNWRVISDSQIVALRRNDVVREVRIPSADTFPRRISQSFRLHEYVELRRSGELIVRNPADTVPERYTVAANARIEAVMCIDDSIMIGTGGGSCIVRSISNGRSWHYRSWFPPITSPGSTPLFRCVGTKLYMPTTNGAFYTLSEGRVAILPQKFEFYPQYLNSPVVFAHYDTSGNGCVIVSAGRETDSNVFVTRDYGDTYRPVGVIPLLNVFSADSVGRKKRRFSASNIFKVTKSEQIYYIAGNPNYLDTLKNVKSYSYSTVIRLDSLYRMIDTVNIPVSNIRSLTESNGRIYLAGMNITNYQGSSSLGDLEYPTYALYESENTGKAWQLISNTLPFPREYIKSGALYQSLKESLRPAVVDSTSILYDGSYTSRLLRFSLKERSFDTVHLPFMQASGYYGASMLASGAQLIAASANSMMYYTTGKSLNTYEWDSIKLSDLIGLDSGSMFYGFVINELNAGYVCTGELMGAGPGVNTYKTHVLRIEPAQHTTDVNVENEKLYLWNTPPYPQPSSGIVNTKVVWDFGLSMSDLRVSIYDIYGNEMEYESGTGVVALSALQQYQALLTLNMTGFTSGVYIVYIQLRDSRRVVPVIKY